MCIRDRGYKRFSKDKLDCSYHLRQLRDPPRHRAIRVAQRIDNGEVVHPGDFLITRRDTASAPALGDNFALAQEFARFERTNHRIERAPGGDFPMQWRYPPRLGVVEARRVSPLHW